MPAHLVNMTKRPKKNDTTATKAGNNNNYFAPLQTVDDDDIDEVPVTSDTISKKTYVSPLTILKCKVEEIQEICNIAKIKEYFVKRISIGIKIFCSSKCDFDVMCNALNGKYEYFTYPTKDEKPYKALLFGLDSQDPAVIKNKLIAKGLQVTDVKIVHKKTIYATMVIYVVYFKRQTITMRELRQNHSIIDYVKVKWDYQAPNKNRITQCHNCQMYGHGSSHCKVKTFCANCAGDHNTRECKESEIQCANCKGPHKSNDVNCPSRTHYLDMKQRSRPMHKQQNKNTLNIVNNNNNFPNTLNQGIPRNIGVWPPQRNIFSARSSNDHNNSIGQNTTPNVEQLFSIQELQKITVDLITKLRNCKNKLDQFEVITNLAFTFLS